MKGEALNERRRYDFMASREGISNKEQGMMNIEVNSSFCGSMFLVRYSSHPHVDSSLIQNVPNEPTEQHKTNGEKERAEIHASMRKNVFKQP